MNASNNAPELNLDTIRRTGQKPDYRTQGNWLARYWARPSAIYGTWIAIKLGLSANTITTLAAVSWLGEAVCIGIGTKYGLLTGVAAGFLGFWLDHVDGQVARSTKSTSLEGIFFDYWMHTAHCLVRAFGLGWGCYRATGDAQAIFAGMTAAFGWVMLSQFNDAKYKAIFAFLKSNKSHVKMKSREGLIPDSDKTQNDAGQQNEQAPHPIQRKSIAQLISTVLTRLQEPHNVLTIELIIAIALISNQSAGIRIWYNCLLFWASVSVLLATGRLVRAVQKKRISEEFQVYFDLNQ